ncbi:MAG: rhodanese-like domain-containing protein [Pseudomonadota bacterium]
MGALAHIAVTDFKGAVMISRRVFVLSASALFAAGALPAYAAQEVTAQQAYQLIQDNPDIIVLDIRTGREFRSGHISGAININYFDQNFRDRIAQLDGSKIYIMHCAAGGRSDASIRILRNAGLTNVYHMGGGTSEWKSQGLPLVR